MFNTVYGQTQVTADCQLQLLKMQVCKMDQMDKDESIYDSSKWMNTTTYLGVFEIVRSVYYFNYQLKSRLDELELKQSEQFTILKIHLNGENSDIRVIYKFKLCCYQSNFTAPQEMFIESGDKSELQHTTVKEASQM